MKSLSVKNNIEKTDLIVIGVSAVILGAIAGFVAYIYLEIVQSLIIAIALGILGGIGVNYVRKTFLADVTYPTPANLTKLTIYTLVMCTVIALMILGLDMLFTQLRGYLL